MGCRAHENGPNYPLENVLVQKMARFRPRYVALVHEPTQTYLTVERPPHSLALKAHALSSTLSVASIFALIKAPRAAHKLHSVYVPASSLTHAERRAQMLAARPSYRDSVAAEAGGIPPPPVLR